MMKKSTLFQLSTLAILIALGAGAWWATRQNNTVDSGLSSQKESDVVREEGARIAQADAQVAVQRKAEAAVIAAGSKGVPAMGQVKQDPGYGQLTPISPDASPQAKAAVEAALTKTHPERLTCAILPAKFDAKKWAEDAAYKAEYLRVPEPARCYQSAQPKKGVKQIALACPAYIETLQNRPVELRVRATPGMPVTFTSFDAAKFTAGSGNTGSQLTTQTVVADENGIAVATLLATPGVIDDCRVIASCPVNSGLAKLVVHAKLPEESQSSVVTVATQPAQ